MATDRPSRRPSARPFGRSAGGGHVRPSPLFLGIVAVTVIAGVFAWNLEGSLTAMRVAVFVMVLGGWVLSLCLHEFAHAYIAYRHGDLDVEARGYLTLNPLRYTHPVLSLLLPMLFIAIGGIGLPGGAVYLRTETMSAAVRRRIALAGPLTNAMLAVLLLAAVQILSGTEAGAPGGSPRGVVYGLAFLGFLQIMAAVLNLLPIPGLDGYAVLEPHLSPDTRRALAQFAPFGIIAVFALLTIQQINSVFFDLIYSIFELSGTPRTFSSIGYLLFRFWA